MSYIYLPYKNQTACIVVNLICLTTASACAAGSVYTLVLVTTKF